MSSSVIATSGRLYAESEHIVMDIIPHCVAVNASLLEVSMDTGATEWRFSNRSKFLDMWLEAAKSNSHVCVWWRGLIFLLKGLPLSHCCASPLLLTPSY